MASTPIALDVPPERALAFWEALDQLVQSPDDHPWGRALAEALRTGPVSVESALAPAINQAGSDLEAFWGFLQSSAQIGAKAVGYAQLADSSFTEFRAGALGLSLRTLLTNLRVFQHCRSVDDLLLFRRLLARLSSYDIRLRRHLAGETDTPDRVIDATAAGSLFALDSGVQLSVEPSAHSTQALSIQVGEAFSAKAEPYVWVGENQLAPVHDSKLSTPQLHIALYLREQRTLLVREAQLPEGEQWLTATLVDLDAQSQVLYEAESELYRYLIPQLNPPTEPIGVLSDGELEYWQQFEALVEVLTRLPTGAAESVETKDTVIWQLLEVLESQATEGVSAYVRQVCAGYLAAQLGYLSTEAEHNVSPRPNSYRDYLAKEVENSVRRRSRHSPTESAVG